jgi:hypothetical protein
VFRHPGTPKTDRSVLREAAEFFGLPARGENSEDGSDYVSSGSINSDHLVALERMTTKRLKMEYSLLKMRYEYSKSELQQADHKRIRAVMKILEER